MCTARNPTRLKILHDASGCVFNALEGTSSDGQAVATTYSSTYFKSCVFRDLSVEARSDTTSAWTWRYGALSSYGFNATLALDNCTLLDMALPWPISVSSGSRLYSDNPDHVVRLLATLHP